MAQIFLEICTSKAEFMGKTKVKFLPTYSPNFNPIEKMWSKVKQNLRGLKPRTNEELCCSTGKALSMVTADDAQGWFGSCGYIQNKS